MKRLISITALMMLSVTTATAADSAAIIAVYQGEAGAAFEAVQGEKLWQRTGKEGRICADCHGNDLSKPGRHVRTKKVIEPMSAAVSGDRYSDPKKVEKWFKRNCKWTWGRECTVAEKGHLLTWLSRQ